MDSFSIPPTIYVAFGVITAALLAGFFSFLNLISAKENKVSEFRLAWVDGLREEISIYTGAVQELVRVDGQGLYDHDGDTEKMSEVELNREWYLETREVYARVAESLSKIQLRINPKHIEENPTGPEAKLMSSILETRDLFNKGYYQESSLFCLDIRNAATPLLKKTWDQVKKGESGYRIIRASALTIIVVGTVFVAGFGYYLISHPIKIEHDLQQTEPTTKINQFNGEKTENPLTQVSTDAPSDKKAIDPRTFLKPSESEAPTPPKSDGTVKQ